MDEKKAKENGHRIRERAYGRFYRALELPQDVAANNVKANYKEGVLELTLPKLESAKPKQIDVEVRLIVDRDDHGQVGLHPEEDRTALGEASASGEAAR